LRKINQAVIRFLEVALAGAPLYYIFRVVPFAGLGARGAILIPLRQPYGVSAADPVALAFLQLGGTVAIAAVGGLFELRNIWRVQGSAETRGVAAPFGDNP
jgi:hypothetical protein